MTMAALALVTDVPLDVTPLEEFVQDAGATAVVTLSTLVREELDYEGHPEAQRILEECCLIVSRELGARVAAAQRTGVLPVGALSLVVTASAPDRADAFAACSRLAGMIELTVPIWTRQRIDGVASL